MSTIALRPADPERDFGQLAALFTILEDQPNSEASLTAYYEEVKDRLFERVADDGQGEVPGFYWLVRELPRPERAKLYLFVKPERRGLGIGRCLYEDAERTAQGAQVQQLQVSVWDNCPADLAFAERRGFTRRAHSMAMALDLPAFDDRPYDELIARLQGEGYVFTSMAELGNTEEAQRKLYVLNETASMDTPGTDGEPPWGSFENFQKSVCQTDWYDPAGQMVVVDTATGAWAAMSAITRFAESDYAYNLFTGVDRLYRGRKLAQAVKVLALRYGRDVLHAGSVHTHHNALNAPMIAIDRKLGYVQTPGLYLMRKELSPAD